MARLEPGLVGEIARGAGRAGGGVVAVGPGNAGQAVGESLAILVEAVGALDAGAVT